MNRINLILLLSLTSGLGGCLYKPPVRVDSLELGYGNCKKYENPIAENETIYNLDKNSAMKIAIIEINDQGILLNKCTADYIVKFIEEKMSKDKNKPIVNLYIHGWNHSGAKGDSDLEAFENANRSLYRSQKALGENERDVVGIYVAWRGRTLPGWFNYATFWDRKRVSEEVGRGELANLIFRLETILKPDQKNENENGTLILVGHSFGASALYNMVQHELISRFYNSLEEQQKDPNAKIKGFGDMIILLNPAIQALRFTPLREAVYREGITRQKSQDNIFKNNLHPNLVVLSTENDFPVRRLFPFGRYLAEAKNYHGTTYTYTNIKGDYEKTSLRKLNNIAIGQYAPYFTHWAWMDKQQEIKIDGEDAKPKAKTKFKKILGYPFSKIKKSNPEHEESANINAYNCLSDKNAVKDQPIQWLSKTIDQYENTEDFYTVDKTNNQDLLKINITNNMNLPNIDKKDGWKELEKNKTEMTWKRNPYWFVRVRKEIIDGHNGIWHRPVSCFFLLLLTTDRDEAGTQTILQPVKRNSGK